MRPWTLLWTLLVCATTVRAQVSVSGHISGVADEPLVISLATDHFGSLGSVKATVVDGRFTVPVVPVEYDWATLSFKDKDRRLFLTATPSELRITFDADFLDGDFRAEGSGADVHHFMGGLEKEHGNRLMTEWLDGQAASATNIDGLEMDLFRFRNDLIAKSKAAPLPEAFRSWFRQHMTFYYYLGLFRYSSAKSRTSTVPKATEIPKVLLDGLSWDRMVETGTLASGYYRALLLEFVDYKALEQYEFMKFSSQDAATTAAWTLTKEKLPIELQRYHLAALMLRDGARIGPGLLRRMLDGLRAIPGSEAEVALVSQRLKERLSAKDEAVAVTKDIPKDKFTLLGLDGKQFGLGSLRGKVVYMDVWASWCGPCRQQFPFAKTLKEGFSKKELKDIVFLYISIDNTEEAWRKALESLGIEGLHGFSPGGWNAPVTSEFGISSIPRYLIFDRQGNLVRPNAPRPSDPELPGLLRSLLAQ